MKAIGFDQSLSGFGWAVLTDTGGGNLLRCGLWRTERDAKPGQVTADNTRRFGFLGQSALELIEAERYDDTGREAVVYIEGVGVFGDRFTTALGQGRLLGIVEGVALTLRMQLVEVAPAEVKRLVPVLGKRRKVEKEEVAAAVFGIYPEGRELVAAAVAEIGGEKAREKAALNVTDAIAIAHVGRTRSTFRAQLSANDGSHW